MRWFCVAILISLMTPSFAWAETLSWDGVWAQTASTHPELKAEALDVAIVETRVKEERAAYFPTLTARWNSEYLRDLDEQAVGGGIQAVGDSLVVNSTQFQHSASVQGQWVVLDFGKRRRRMKQARWVQEQEQYDYAARRRQLMVQLADTYVRAWFAQERLNLAERQVAVAEQLATSQQRLHKAGRIRKTELADSSLIWMERHQGLGEAQSDFIEALTELSSYTQTAYSKGTTNLTPFPPDAFEGDAFQVTVSEAPEVKQLEAQIEEKAVELSLLRRERWTPTVTATGTYLLFGSDTNAIGDSVRDVTPSNLRVGFNVTIPVFDGFRNKAQRERVKLEMEQLEYRKKATVTRLQSEVKSVKAELASTPEQLKVGEQIATEGDALKGYALRLRQQKLIPSSEALNTQLRALAQQEAQLELQRDWQLTQLQAQSFQESF